MPRLVKGSKHVYGWSKVTQKGRIIISNKALAEYTFKPNNKLILLPGSKSSGGFALTTIALLEKSPLSSILSKNPKLAKFQISQGETVKINKKHYCWTTLNQDGSIIIPEKTLNEYKINLGDLLLSVKRSKLALAFCVKGPLIAEAKKHPNLIIF